MDNTSGLSLRQILRAVRMRWGWAVVMTVLVFGSVLATEPVGVWSSVTAAVGAAGFVAGTAAVWNGFAEGAGAAGATVVGAVATGAGSGCSEASARERT